MWRQCDARLQLDGEWPRPRAAVAVGVYGAQLDRERLVLVRVHAEHEELGKAAVIRPILHRVERRRHDLHVQQRGRTAAATATLTLALTVTTTAIVVMRVGVAALGGRGDSDHIVGNFGEAEDRSSAGVAAACRVPEDGRARGDHHAFVLVVRLEQLVRIVGTLDLIKCSYLF